MYSVFTSVRPNIILYAKTNLLSEIMHVNSHVSLTHESLLRLVSSPRTEENTATRPKPERRTREKARYLNNERWLQRRSQRVTARSPVCEVRCSSCLPATSPAVISAAWKSILQSLWRMSRLSSPLYLWANQVYFSFPCVCVSVYLPASAKSSAK